MNIQKDQNMFLSFTLTDYDTVNCCHMRWYTHSTALTCVSLSLHTQVFYFDTNVIFSSFQGWLMPLEEHQLWPISLSLFQRSPFSYQVVHKKTGKWFKTVSGNGRKTASTANLRHLSRMTDENTDQKKNNNHISIKHLDNKCQVILAWWIQKQLSFPQKII